jgi:hypothetical protein
VAEILMPRWGGQSGDSAAYAEKVAARIGGPAGSMVYARITERMLYYYDADEVFHKEQFNYDAFKKGMEEILRQYPDDPLTLYALLRTAWQLKNRPDAERYWKQIESRDVRVRRGPWGPGEFDQARQWLGDNVKAGESGKP